MVTALVDRMVSILLYICCVKIYIVEVEVNWIVLLINLPIDVVEVTILDKATKCNAISVRTIMVVSLMRLIILLIDLIMI